MEMNAEYVLNTGTVNYLGVDHQTYAEFRGIKYAASGRWERPHLLNPTQVMDRYDSSAATYDAAHWGKKCWQYDWTPEDFYGKEFYDEGRYDVEKSEDCLYLNIFMPKEIRLDQNPKGFPVAIWVHGGGFINGWNSEKEFDGKGFAERGVILVTINYRLGIFGFFAQSKLRERDPHACNPGLQDILTAIAWVKTHIEEFGGDSDRITLFGQSAGSMGIMALASSPLMKGLVQNFIFQSGSVIDRNVKIPSYNAHEPLADRWMKENEISIEQLLTVDAGKLFEIGDQYMHFLYQNNTGYRPLIDGYILPEEPLTALNEGRFVDANYLIGCMKDDIINAGDPLRLYNANLQLGQKLSEQGNAVYEYIFRHELPGDNSGAFHAGDLWYVFGTVKRSWRPMTDVDVQLSNIVMDYWTSFMKNGVPDTDGDWRRFSDERQYVQGIDLGQGLQKYDIGMGNPSSVS